MSALAYHNGKLVAAESLSLPVTDWGFMQGVTVAEQLRTYAGRPWQVERHMQRLTRGLQVIGLDECVDVASLQRPLQEVVAHNYALIDSQDDLGICVFVTPGIYPTYRAPGGDNLPTVCIHTYALPFRRWAEAYQHGQSLVTVATRQVSDHHWPAEIKCRSRMHYYLAAREAHETRPGATALLCDDHGDLCETPTANLLVFFAGRGLVTPSSKSALPGISLQSVIELAQQLGIATSSERLSMHDLRGADEIMLTSTPFAILPVVDVDDYHLGPPGNVFGQLIKALSDQTKVDIVQQAVKFAAR